MIVESNYNWEKIQSGAAKYDFLMNRFLETDVSKDDEFRRKFTGFYKIRRSKTLFLNKYYNLMESLKGNPVAYSKIIKEVSSFQNAIEASFSSKMLATLNPDMPIWDRYVLENIGIKAPQQYRKTINVCIEIYSEIVKWYKNFMNTQDSREMLFAFNKKLPEYKHFSDIKKIDLMLWQKRSKQM
ncbi:MAG TPA: hypothetical protein PLL42_01860 [Bacilli bacterium]|nr:hypothetical protein [Bacilli bacterium]